MAKQSGLHQLKGKVDGYSYYRQSGVKDGLMRRINEGMSSRVKTSEEFANTRLNCREFGNAADVAKVLASVITPKFRPMFLNFSQAKLTKSLLAIIKQATMDWGQRAIGEDREASICDAVNALAKNDFSLYCDSVTSEAGTSSGRTKLTISFTTDNKNNLEGIGADGIDVKSVIFTLYAGQYSDIDHGYIKSQSKISYSEMDTLSLGDIPDNVEVQQNAQEPAVSGTISVRLSLVILLPYRTINGNNYTLQEKCTFKMIPSVVAE